jgi:nitroreductase
MATHTQALDALSAIEARRSVKHFDPTFSLPPADEERLVQAMMWAPTSFNIQNWRFVLVKAPEQREAIFQVAWQQSQVKDASMLVVFCGNLHSALEQPERYWRNAPQEIQDILVPKIPEFYENNPQAQRDEVMRSVGMAAQNLMIAAKAMGYDSCPMVGFDPVKVADLIQLPKNYLVSMMVVVGKALQPARARGGQLSREEVCFIDRF